MRNLALILLGILCSAPPAAAQSAVALAAYQSGDYDRAIVEAGPRCADTSAFRARARLSKIIAEGVTPLAAALESARADAEAALVTDPDHAEARLQLAISLSLMTREMSQREAWSSGYGTTARQLAETALADAPDLYQADGFLSVWHIEVLRRGGSAGALWLKASLKDARVHYQRAQAKGGADPGLHWQYARALAALNTKKHAAEIDAALAAALSAEPRSQLDGVMIARARTLKTTLDTQGAAAAQAFALAAF